MEEQPFVNERGDGEREVGMEGALRYVITRDPPHIWGPTSTNGSGGGWRNEPVTCENYTMTDAPVDRGAPYVEYFSHTGPAKCQGVGHGQFT